MARTGQGAVMAITLQGHIVGQISLGAVSYGSLRSGMVGYWVAQDCAGQGVAPMAVALMADWALLDSRGPQLHRMEIAIMPHNLRSLRVMDKVGAHREGVMRRYMYVGNQWCDHVVYTMMCEDVPDGFVAQLLLRHAITPRTRNIHKVPYSC